ncbi:MAG: hypothetical protein WCI56_06435 [Hyphomicrobiales bacterium]
MTLKQTFFSVAIACMISLAAPAFASDGPQSAAAAKASAAALVAYTETAAKNGERPNYTTAPIAGHLKRIFDIDALAALPPEKAGDIEWLLDWGDSANIGYKILVRYEAGKDGGPQAAARNLIDHENEISSGLSFTLRLQSRMARTGPLFMESLPPEQRTDIRKRGFEGYTRQLVGTVLSTSGMLASMTMKPGNAAVIAASLRDTANAWLPYTTADERAQLAELLKRSSTVNSEARPALDTATATISKFRN